MILGGINQPKQVTKEKKTSAKSPKKEEKPQTQELHLFSSLTPPAPGLVIGINYVSTQRQTDRQSDNAAVFLQSMFHGSSCCHFHTKPRCKLFSSYYFLFIEARAGTFSAESDSCRFQERRWGWGVVSLLQLQKRFNSGTQMVARGPHASR